MSADERPDDAEGLYAYHCGQVDGMREALRVMVGGRNGPEKLRRMIAVARDLADEQQDILRGHVDGPVPS